MTTISVEPTEVRRFRLRKPLAGWMIGTAVLTLAAASGRIVIPVVVQQVVDHRTRPFGVVGLFVLAGGAVVVATVAMGLVNVGLARSTERILHGLRVRVSQHRAGESRPAGTKRLVDDIDQFSQFVRWNAPMLLLNAGQLLVAAGLMFMYSWELAALAALAFLPLARARRWFRRWLVRDITSRRIAEELHDAAAELVHGSADGWSEEDRRQVAKHIDRAATFRDLHDMRAARGNALQLAYNEIVTGLTMAVVIVAGVALAAAGLVTPGRLAAVLLVMALIASPAHVAVGAIRDGRLALAGWHRISRSVRNDNVAGPRQRSRTPTG